MNAELIVVLIIIVLIGGALGGAALYGRNDKAAAERLRELRALQALSDRDSQIAQLAEIADTLVDEFKKIRKRFKSKPALPHRNRVQLKVTVSQLSSQARDLPKLPTFDDEDLRLIRSLKSLLDISDPLNLGSHGPTWVEETDVIISGGTDLAAAFRARRRPQETAEA
jgi:hypothetical protein